MNNGQLNVTSAQPATPLLARAPDVSNANAIDGVQQNGGSFAEVLGGARLLVKRELLPDTAKDEQLVSDAGTDQQAADLLALLQVQQIITPLPGAAAPELGDPEDTDITVMQVGPPSELTSQMALAAYSQPGRTPEVNSMTAVPVDTLQKVAMVSERPTVISAPAVTTSTERTAAELMLAQPLKPIVTPAKEPVAYFAAEQNQHHQSETVRSTAVDRQSVTTVETETATPPATHQKLSERTSSINNPTPPTVDRLQNVAGVPAQPAIIATPAVELQSEQKVGGTIQAPQVIPSVQLGSAKESAPASSPQPVTSDRMSAVNIPTPLPVGRPQNVASVAAQPAAEQNQQRQPETVRTSFVDGQPVTIVAAPVMATPTAAPATTATTSTQPVQTSATALHSVALVPASSPVSEVEIQLSQPQPITAQVTTAPAVSGNQEKQGAWQLLNPEQQIEKVRTGHEQSTVKETASSLQAAASASESALGSETSSGSDNNQGQPDSDPDNQMLAQQMRGQLSTEHQKVAALSAKAVPTEPARQGIPEQVMQQVKERLVQHDVKPGNQRITLTLSPDSLGELKMNLNLQGQKLSVEIVAENRTVRDSIMQHTDALKESLARQNITMESFDVTTGGKGSGNQGQNQNAWRELAKQQQQWASPRGYQTAQADLPASSDAYQKQQGHTMLDIHY